MTKTYDQPLKVLGLLEERNGLGHALHRHADSGAGASNAGRGKSTGIRQCDKDNNKSEHYL